MGWNLKVLTPSNWLLGLALARYFNSYELALFIDVNTDFSLRYFLPAAQKRFVFYMANDPISPGGHPRWSLRLDKDRDDPVHHKKPISGFCRRKFLSSIISTITSLVFLEEKNIQSSQLNENRLVVCKNKIISEKSYNLLCYSDYF